MKNLFEIKFQKKIPFIYINRNQMFSLFFIFILTGFLGFILETTGYFILYDEIIDCGFLIGPFIPIYGVTVILVLLFLRYPKITVRNYFVISLIIAVIATLTEFIVGNLVEYLTGAVLWSYIDSMPLTYKYISIPISVCWGILGSFYFFIIIPIFKKISDSFSKKIKIIIITLFTSLFIIDLVITIILLIINNGYYTLY